MERLSEARIAEMAEKLAGCDYPWVEAVADVRALLQDRVLLRGERDEARQQRDDYKECYEDTKRLARSLDVAMHGEANAATGPSLCDLIGPAEDLRTRAEAAEQQRDQLQAEMVRRQSRALDYSFEKSQEILARETKRAESAEQQVGTLTAEREQLLARVEKDHNHEECISTMTADFHEATEQMLSRAEAAESALVALQGACEQLLKQHAPRFVLGDPLIEGLNILLTTPPVRSEETR